MKAMIIAEHLTNTNRNEYKVLERPNMAEPSRLPKLCKFILFSHSQPHIKRPEFMMQATIRSWCGQ